MDDREFESLMEPLLALGADAFEEPRMPMATALQEANDLETLLTEDAAVTPKLLAIGLPKEVVLALGPAVSLAREAQSRWVVVRDRSKPEAQREREARGGALRQELLSAARWNLRDDRASLGTLSAIAEGESLADLIQDLNDLAELIERKRAAFARDETFDVATSVEEARALSSEISAGVGAARLESDAATARGLRDRAYTHMAEVVGEVREAGRHAYRHEPPMQRYFTSRYLERKRRAHAAAQPKAPAEA
jgi:hypothetical protein